MFHIVHYLSPDSIIDYLHLWCAAICSASIEYVHVKNIHRRESLSSSLSRIKRNKPTFQVEGSNGLFRQIAKRTS
jgi:hypothetical protein